MQERNSNINSNLEISPLSITYSNKKIYGKKMINAIENEMETLLEKNKNSPLINVDLEFDYIHNKQCYITINKPIFKLFEKNSLDIFKNGKLIIEGAIVRDKKDDKLILFSDSIKHKYENGIYQVQLLESVKNYERIIDWIKKFIKKNLMNLIIVLMLLGQVVDINSNIRDINIPPIKLIPKFIEEGIKINRSQEIAIKNAFMYFLSIIIGPPGSGKTLLLINLVYNILFRKRSNEKILICAPTNKAIDNIINYLKKYNFEKFIRVLSPAKELSEDLDTTRSVHKLALEKIYKEPKKYGELIKLYEKKQKNKILEESEYKIYKQKMGDVEDEIIENSDIILTTINNSADERLKNYFFSYVLIDEAAQALEPDTLLPLLHQAQMLVLIGDDKQLGPVVHSEKAKADGLEISLFQRLHTIYGNSPIITLLNEQYRMNEKLYEFPNMKFYGNKMITKVKILPDENILKNFPWPKKDYPALFYNISGNEEIENKSYYNKDEVFAVFKCVNKLIENKVDIKNIGVITFYSGQKQRFYEKINTNEKYQNLIIDTVDGFQGMEMDYIIISTVRANLYGNLGFLRRKERLNVALTRARKGLIIIGDAKCLAKRPGDFRELIAYYCSNELIVNEPFRNCTIVKKEEIFNNNIVFDYEDDYDEIIEEENERNYYGEINFRMIKKVKNEKPAPVPSQAVIINQHNINKINQDKQIKKEENKNINNKEGNKKNNNKNKNNREEEKIQEAKYKKKKKAKKMEENEEEKDDKEDLKKKGNKKWQIKNLYCKKKKAEKKEEDIKIEEEEKNGKDANEKKKGRKNKSKQINEEEKANKKKNEKNKKKNK